MNERKLKSAFEKIKIDMLALSSQLNELREDKNKQTEVSNSQIKKELKEINELLKTFGSTVESNRKKIETLLKQLMIRNEQFEELISEKISMELGNLDLKETQDNINLKEEIKLVREEISELASKGLGQNVEDAFTEFNELINEKIQIELNSLRLEVTEEIAKLYDKCFSEILELKGELNKINKKSKSKMSIPKPPKSLQKKSKPKKEGKIKKVAKWLFVDEEEDEISSIKKEVKKNK